MPTAADHPLARSTHPVSQPRGRRCPQLVLTLGSPPLQIAGTPQTHADLRVRPQPHQVTLIELATATPTHRRRRLKRLLSSGHNAIIRRPGHRGYQPRASHLIPARTPDNHSEAPSRRSMTTSPPASEALVFAFLTSAALDADWSARTVAFIRPTAWSSWVRGVACPPAARASPRRGPPAAAGGVRRAGPRWRCRGPGRSSARRRAARRVG